MLGTSRSNPYKVDGGPDKCLATLRGKQVDALVAIGGDDTLGVANKLSAQGVAVVGVPCVVVVAEGATPKEGSFSLVSGEVDQFGHARLGGIGNRLAEEIQKRTGLRRGRLCWATCSAVARQQLLTASLPRASA